MKPADPPISLCPEPMREHQKRALQLKLQDLAREAKNCERRALELALPVTAARIATIARPIEELVAELGKDAR